MDLKTCLKSQVQEYLLENPINDTAKNKYAEVCKQFNIDIKTASKYWIDLKTKEKEYIDYHNSFLNTIPEANYTQQEVKKVLKQEGDSLSITTKVDREIKTLEDLLQVCEVDSTKWEIVSWECKKWDLGIKNTANQIETKELYSVSAKFKAIKLEENLILQKQVILEELFSSAPSFTKFEKTEKPSAGSNLLEISIPDLHIGKLAHREESGEDYDIKIAVERYKTAISSLLSRVNLTNVGKILLPIGNDIIQIDNNQNTTTAGTRVDTDGRYFKIVRSVKHLLIETINTLSKIAPVDVVVVCGNHDSQTTFLIGEILEAYYFNVETVNVLNGAALRKYYKYGNTGMLFTHGDKEKHTSLGMIFAAENPKLWADTKYRFIKLGHLHHNKKIDYITTQEYQGFQVQVLPSLSGSDQWHYGRGYMSLKQAKAFLYDKEAGLIGEFTYSL
jgi:hypothetical protein